MKYQDPRVRLNIFLIYIQPDYLVLEAENCTVSEVLLEKMRPSRQASIYNNTKSYIDMVSPFSNGELLEYQK